MAGLFGTARNTQATKLGGIRVQTAEYGVCIPVIIGNNRIGTKLIDYQDFQSVAQSSNAGGKGGGGTASSYEYFAAVLMLLCEGPCGGIGSIYDSSGSANLTHNTETFVISGDHTVSVGQSPFYYDGGATVATAFSVTATDYGGNGTHTTTGTQQVPLQRIDPSLTPGPGQYTVYTVNTFGSQGVYKFNAADFGKTVTITYTYTLDAAGNVSPIELLQLSLFDGTRPQTPWGYMASAHPERALAYAGRVLVADSDMDLGSDASIPNYQFEVLQGGGVAQTGSDCNFADVLTVILSNPYWGALWPFLGDLTQYRAYCQANGLFISPVYDSASALSEVLTNLLALSNSEAVWANKALTVVTYGDTTVTGNGATFTPDTQPILDLDDSCFLIDGDGDGITVSRPDLTDNYNHYFIEFGDRAANYNTNTIEDKDEAAIATYGYRTGGTVTAHEITELAVAQKVINTIVRRSSYPLATYVFKLPFWFSWLLPMQVVTITKPKLGMYRVPVRIKEVQEEDDDSVEITAETFPWGVALPAAYSTQPTAPLSPSGRNYPGNVNNPLFIAASPRMTQNGNPEVWVGLSGPAADWGGCNVWLSLDGVTYAKVGKQAQRSRMGLTTAAFLTGADPDTTNSLAVDMTESHSTLGNGTMADADNLATLCFVGGELVSYQVATLTAAFKYTLGTYMRRGVFSSPITDHASGSAFMRLDDAVFRYQYDPTLVGKTVFFKFTSFNLFAQMEQTLADVLAYPYTVGTTSTTSQNMTLSPSLETGGTTAKLDLFQTGTTAGTDGTATLSTGAVITLPAHTFTALVCATWYGVNYNVTTATYVIYTDMSAWSADQTAGLLAIGSTTTPPTAGGGTYYPQSAEDSEVYPTDNASAEFTPGGGATVYGFAQSTYTTSDGL
jgi:hypothetical protein